ncbi:MAG: GNAT family N-acetyltransferase [Propioniciclava sp.]
MPSTIQSEEVAWENHVMDPRMRAIFPPLGLRLSSGRLELRGIGEEEVLALVDVVREGVHPTDQMPFSFPWTDVDPGDLPLNYLQWWWRGMALWSTDAWSLDLCVRWDGEVVGVQGVTTQDFLTLRFGETGSWLGQRHQGAGIGTAMRRALCTLLFEHLDFEFVTSAAFTDNPASLRVSEKLGFRENGSNRHARRGDPVEMRHLMLNREDFVPDPELRVEGVPAMRRFIGLDS